MVDILSGVPEDVEVNRGPQNAVTPKEEVYVPIDEEDTLDKQEDELDYVLESLGEIAKFLKDNGYPITIGPIYRTQSRGETVDILTAYKIVEVKGKPVLTILFTAIDQHQRLIGHRTTYLDELPASYIATGNINMARRNAGMVLPIELSNGDFLQRYAQEKKKDVYYHLINGNENYLNDLRRQYDELVATINNSPEWQRRKQYLEKEIERTEKEQIGWKKVWGEHGKLGFEDGGKTYDHLAHVKGEQILANIDLIEFEREDKAGIATSHIVSITDVSKEKAERDAEGIEKLKEILSKERALYY